MIEFWVPGKPQSQGHKVKTQWGVRESNKELGPWRERVALAAYEAKSALDAAFDILMSGPVAVGLEFVLYRPQSTPKSKTPPATKAPDADTLARACLDAMTHVIYQDDSQVTTLLIHKRVAQLGESPGVRISVTTDQTCYIDDISRLETEGVTGSM